jgi:DNA-binding MarR family transcriptional regulator
MLYSVTPDVISEPAAPLVLPEELLAKSGFLMVRLGAGFKARAVAAMEAAGFSQYHYSVLALLAEQPRKAQSAMADALGLDPSQLVGVLDALERRELIERRRDAEDRRRHVVSLTTKGRSELATLRETMDRVEDELFAPLDAKSRKTFHEILLRLAAYHDPRCAETPCS